MWLGKPSFGVAHRIKQKLRENVAESAFVLLQEDEDVLRQAVC